MTTTVVLIVLMVIVLGLFLWVLSLAEHLKYLERRQEADTRHLERLTDRLVKHEIRGAYRLSEEQEVAAKLREEVAYREELKRRGA